MKKYFEKVDENRMVVASKSKETIWNKGKNAIDPLEKWKEARAAGKIKPLGYEAVPGKKESKTGLTFVIPLNPIDRPEMDNGERFDLRLPYAERGYEDADSDVMGNFMKGVAGLFGGGKKGKDNEQKKNK